MTVITRVALLTFITLTAALTAAATSPQDVRTPVAGSTIPAADVHNGTETINLATHLGTGKHILIVYRGGWCPLCTHHFAAIASTKAELQQAGWQLSALSPDSATSIATWTAKHGHDGITRLSDSKAAAIEALGLGFRVDDATMKALAGYGIDIIKAAGADHRILPVPTVLLIVDGEIRGVHADADYRRRLHPGILKAMVTVIDRTTAK